MMLASFSSAFLHGDPRTLGFLPADFRDPVARSRITRAAGQRRVGPELLAALHEQNGRLPPSPARQQNLAALAAPGANGTAAVVAGQQVGLFLGPLYTFYKAATAVAVARALTRETGTPCVPIFWLQTEDHDYQEINHCYVPRYAAPPLRLQLAAAAGERSSIAHRQIGGEVTAQLAALAETLGTEPHAAEFLDLLRQHYRPEATLGAAFAGVLGALFADEGLLILDPRCTAIAALAAPLYHQAIVDEKAITTALLTRRSALQAAGCSEQIPTRPDTTLVFFHDGSATGPRYRLERYDTDWSIPGRGAVAAGPGRQLLTEQELLTTLHREPLRFSSSALLRPLIQDTLLPTAAYIGGPAEISYCSQLAELYELFAVAQPLVMPRARFRCLEDNTRSWLAKLQLPAAEAEAPRADVLRRFAARPQDERPTPEAVRARMLADISTQLTDLESRDAALRDPVRRARDSIERTVSRLTERYAQAILERDHVTTERVDRVQNFLYPEGMPQERFYSLPYFACRYGVRAFKQKVFDCLPDVSLFAPAVRDLDL